MPEAQGQLLLCIPDPEGTIERAEQLGQQVLDAYWQQFLPYGLGSFKLAERAARELLARDRVVTALDLLSLYAGRSDEPISATLIADALEALLDTPRREEELGRLSSYELEHLLDYVRASGELDLPRMAALEWRFLPALGFEGKSPTLELQLATDPSFFLEILSLAYRPRNREQEAEVPPHVASNAYQVLDEWRIVPGSTERGGSVDVDALRLWVAKARELAMQADRTDVADVHIGHVFAYAATDEDGTWPTLPVRTVIEETASEALDSGFVTQIYNKRGVTSRGLTDGGRQEYVLADDYEEKAKRTADRWPRVSAALRSVAEGYRSEGRRNDEESERFRAGLDRR
jgi:hypothetical protein